MSTITHTYKNVPWIILRVVELVSVVIYVLFLAVLWRYRNKLTSPFFRLSFILGIADLLYVAVSNGYMFIISFPSVHHWPATTRIMMRYIELCTWNGIFYTQLLGVSIIAFNRFTALVLPHKHDLLWYGVTPLVVAVCVQWFPCLLYTTIIVAHPTFKLRPSNVSLALGYTMTDKANAVQFAVDTVYTILISVFILMAYLGMFVKLVIHRHQMGTLQPSEQVKEARIQEAKLSIVGLVLGLSVACYTLLNVVALLEAMHKISPRLEQTLICYLGNPVDFVFVFSNPYMTLIMSESVRRCFWQYLRRSHQ